MKTEQSMSLFNINGARFSTCGKYRYALWRIWDVRMPMIMFIGLNPSTATVNTDDPTIRRVRRISQHLGYGGFYMLNLFAWVSPYPEDLVKVADPLGENDKHLQEFASRSLTIMAAWGAFEVAKERAKTVRAMFPAMHALVINADGSPRHPLYVPTNIYPQPYNP